MRHVRCMLMLFKRLAFSLIAAGTASVAAYYIFFRLAWWRLIAFETHADGQAGMGPFFGATYVALIVAMATFVRFSGAVGGDR